MKIRIEQHWGYTGVNARNDQYPYKFSAPKNRAFTSYRSAEHNATMILQHKDLGSYRLVMLWPGGRQWATRIFEHAWRDLP
jgi:hypothetical protein